VDLVGSWVHPLDAAMARAALVTGKECHFPFIAWFDLDIVIAPSHVELGEESTPCHSVDDFRD
jgi:hypothetical protein